jgi:hypothetical protein
MTSTSPAPADSGGGGKSHEPSGAVQCSITPLDYGTTGQLFDEIRDFLTHHPGLTTEAVLKLTYFAFAILFPECAEIWPFASVVATDPVGSTLLLRLIACVCIAPLQIGELTLNAILTLPQKPRPALLIVDQLAPNKELERVLRVVSRPGGCILRKGKFYDVCIPTLVCTAEPLRDRWILNQALQIVLPPIRGPLPKLDAKSLEESARRLRGKLVRYRELSFAKVRDAHFDVPHFTSPTREIACMLGNSIVDDPALQRSLLMILEPQDQDVCIRRTDSIEAVVAEAALFLSHEGARSQARVGEIATVASGICKGRGENIILDPRAVGHHLRALGLFSQRLGRAGRGILFASEIRRKIHELAQAYEVRTALDNPSCTFCAEVKSRTTDAPNRGN